MLSKQNRTTNDRTTRQKQSWDIRGISNPIRNTRTIARPSNGPTLKLFFHLFLIFSRSSSQPCRLYLCPPSLSSKSSIKHHGWRMPCPPPPLPPARHPPHVGSFSAAGHACPLLLACGVQLAVYLAGTSGVPRDRLGSQDRGAVLPWKRKGSAPMPA